jgi:bifunctional oligoribonuclease and PAP phosphatase NrnA
MISEPRKDTQSIQKLFEGDKKRIVILGHTHPDGDAVGAGLALRDFLLSLGHQTDFILPDPYPEFLAWMPGADSIAVHQHPEQQQHVEQLLTLADIYIFVDLNSVSRVESLEEIVNEQIDSKIAILFDHHIKPDPIFNFMFWYTDVSSTSELIYEFLCETGHKDKISKIMAENLYVGIMTDTGSFSYSCNRPETYLAVSHFFSLGIDGAFIHQLVYNTFTEHRLRLLGHSLSDRLIVNQEKGGAYIALSAYDLEKYRYQVGDTEGLVNYTMSIKGIHFGALLTEMDKYIKISFRSEGKIDVNHLAQKFFKGGGHKNAAGAYFFGSLSEACDIIEDIISKQLILKS